MYQQDGGGSGPAKTSWQSVADQAFDVIVHALMQAPSERALARIRVFESRLSAVEARIVNKRSDAGCSDRSNDEALGRGSTTSKHESRKKRRRADATNDNPRLADDVDREELSVEQLDAIAEANHKTRGAASRDQRFIDRVKAANPDQARRLARKFVDGWETANKKESRYEKQRRKRGVYRLRRNLNGLDSLTIEGDTESINEIESAFEGEADRLYKADGGREVPSDEHPRTNKQRLFDAACNLIYRPQAETVDGTHSEASSNRVGVQSARAQVHIHVHATDLANGKLIGRLSDGSTLPTAVLGRYLCEADWAATLFDEDGEILHHGRNRRHASPAQRRALIARDQGCVLCAADANRCVAHHLLPWSAPKRGETNIDELALMCDDCHHHIHGNQLTLYHQLGPPDTRGHPTRIWKTRSATFEETPPPPPEGVRKKSDYKPPDAGPSTATPRPHRQSSGDPTPPTLNERRLW